MRESNGGLVEPLLLVSSQGQDRSMRLWKGLRRTQKVSKVCTGGKKCHVRWDSGALRQWGCHVQKMIALVLGRSRIGRVSLSRIQSLANERFQQDPAIV